MNCYIKLESIHEQGYFEQVNKMKFMTEHRN